VFDVLLKLAIYLRALPHFFC